jgi:hypothetical protein
VQSNTINISHTYLATINYWAPLHKTEEDEYIEETNTIKPVQTTENTSSNKWTRQVERQQATKLVIDLRVTSNFATEDMNLPMKGKSHKEVYLPDNTKFHVSYKTELPFKELTSRAREVNVKPGLKTPLMSVNKMAEEGYTTIFHPGEEGVTIHKPGTLTIAMTEPPILQGCKPKGAKLWIILVKSETNTEQANNAYNLPSISQTVRYHHAATGFLVADTWIKAIKAGNNNTWPTITPSTVQRHSPESMRHKKDT